MEQLPSFGNFHMEVEHTLTCMACSFSWTRLEPLRDLSLELPEASSVGTRRPPTAADLLRNFFADDELEVRGVFEYSWSNCTIVVVPALLFAHPLAMSVL